MKIRILSFQNAQNFGALLQAYGLQKALEGMGYNDVAFLNYNPEYLKKRYQIFTKTNLGLKQYDPHYLLAWLANTPFYIINRLRKRRLFNKFRSRRLCITGSEFGSADSIRGIRCDYLICGSDQIWSSWITGGPDPVFYGAGNYSGLKNTFSYAASSEPSTYDDAESVDRIKVLLSNLSHISVREKLIQEILERISGREIELCVDPTLLCGIEKYDEIASRRKISKPYILVYAYSVSKNIMDIVHSIPNYEDYEIHYISFGVSGLRESINRHYHLEVSIEDYLSLFKYASYIVTNSFHGLAFSLLYHKPFMVAYVKGLSTRCESLLSETGLSDRLIKDIKDAKWQQIDYEPVDVRISEMRQSSRAFLSKCLSSDGGINTETEISIE